MYHIIKKKLIVELNSSKSNVILKSSKKSVLGSKSIIL